VRDEGDAGAEDSPIRRASPGGVEGLPRAHAVRRAPPSACRASGRSSTTTQTRLLLSNGEMPVACVPPAFSARKYALHGGSV
jgi:hypothetical protein